MNKNEAKGLLFPSPIVPPAHFLFISPHSLEHKEENCCPKEGYVFEKFFVLSRVRVSNTQRLTYTQILVECPPLGSPNLTLACTQILVEYPPSPEAEASTSTRKSTYLGYVHTKYRIVFAPARKPYQIGLQFTHNNGDFGAISVTERSCAAPIS